VHNKKYGDAGASASQFRILVGWDFIERPKIVGEAVGFPWDDSVVPYKNVTLRMLRLSSLAAKLEKST
jgi:hypothetical protein